MSTADPDKLPAMQYLVLEVLAARRRTGEHAWTFPNRVRPTLRALEAAGLLQFKAAPRSGQFLAWMTDEGASLFLSDDYTPPQTSVEIVCGACLSPLYTGRVKSVNPLRLFVGMCSYCFREAAARKAG